MKFTEQGGERDYKLGLADGREDDDWNPRYDSAAYRLGYWWGYCEGSREIGPSQQTV